MIVIKSGEIHMEDSLMPYTKVYDENTPRVCIEVYMYFHLSLTTGEG